MPEVTDETVAKGRGGERLGELEVVSVKKLFAGLMDILNLVAEVIGGDAILQELAEAFVVVVGLHEFDGGLSLLVEEGDMTAMGREINHGLRGIAKSLEGDGSVLYGVGDVTDVVEKHGELRVES